jgi:hypothetical protein
MQHAPSASDVLVNMLVVGRTPVPPGNIEGNYLEAGGTKAYAKCEQTDMLCQR